MPSFYHTIEKASFAQHFIKNDHIQEKGSQTWVLPEENSSSILEMMVISKLKATPIGKTMCYHLCTEPKLSTCLLQAIFRPGQNCMDAHSYINPKTQKFPSCNIYYYRFQTLQRSHFYRLRQLFELMSKQKCTKQKLDQASHFKTSSKHIWDVIMWHSSSIILHGKDIKVLSSNYRERFRIGLSPIVI